MGMAPDGCIFWLMVLVFCVGSTTSETEARKQSILG
jgi:hypothetical protein